MRRRTMAAAVIALSAASAAQAKVDQKPFGKTAAGQAVEAYTIANAKGSIITVLTYGATLQRVQMPDKSGTVGDVLLGYDTLADYETKHGPYFGALCGRVANRIAKGTFSVDGKTHHVPVNNGPNALHGGKVGYDRRVWSAEAVGDDGVRLTLTDPDGEQGFPGTVHVTVTYTLTPGDTLRIEYAGTTDQATPFNPTMHGYWNLHDGGNSAVLDEVAKWDATQYVPVNAVQIPTGAVADVAGTPFDFRQAKPIGQDLKATGGAVPGYDHTMVVNGQPGSLRPAVTVTDPATGRQLRMFTTAPGVQFYTANFLDDQTVGRGGVVFGQYHGFALEAQDYPDAVNQPAFPSCILRPGETYRQTTEYRFGVVKS